MDDVRVYNKVLTQCEVDSLCSVRLVSGVGDIGKTQIGLFPNPNTGIFTVELPEAATSSITLRVTDLLGRVLLDKKADIGKQIQTIQSATLTDGLYFLQVLSEGKVIAIEKFVKQ